MNSNDRKSIITLLVFFEVVLCGAVVYSICSGKDFFVPVMNERPILPLMLFGIIAIPIQVIDQIKKLRKDKMKGKS